MSTSNLMLDAALSYAARGWHVLPLHSCQEGRCSCGKTECNAGKHSRTRHGVADATNDGRKIRSWWRRWPDANVAIATGAASGLVVIDLDNKNGKAGEASFRTLADQYEGVPATMTVATGNGLHLYFRHPGVAVVNSVCKLGDGVDVKADGGYVVAPPSVHQSGRLYQFENAFAVLELPQWLEHKIADSDACRLSEEREMCSTEKAEDVSEGSRNDRLTSLAYGMRVRAGKQQDEIERSLLAFNRSNCKPPLPEAEVIQMVKRTCEKFPARMQQKSQKRQQAGLLYWFKLNTRELMGDQHLASLSDYQMGWYIRLIAFAWSNGGFLVADEAKLRRLAQADSADDFKAEYRAVLRGFETFENCHGEKFLVNEEMVEEYSQVLIKWHKKAEAGERRHQ